MASWSRVVFVSAGSPQVLAQGVLSFDLEPDGSAVYSNGSALYRVDRSGKRELMLSHANIEQVVALQNQLPTSTRPSFAPPYLANGLAMVSCRRRLGC